MKIIKITENQLNEVRYINAASRDKHSYIPRPYRKDWRDLYNQGPIKNDESIRVFHGCNLNTALEICTKGTSGKVYHPRSYSYETGMNPLGIFVTVNFEKAKDFGYDTKAKCVLEFTVKASDLETPVWNNSDSYFSAGSNPQPFTNADERKAQKAKYDRNALNMSDDSYWDFSKKKRITIDKSHIRNSDKPAMAQNIFNNTEHQALFMGDLNPNMIKYVWVQRRGENQYQRYKEKDFVRLFGENNSKRNGIVSKYSKSLFNPNDNVSSYKDIINRILDLYSDEHISKERLFSNIKEIGLADNPPTSDTAIEYLRRNVWPKQIIQAYGREFFNKNFNRLEQDF